MKNLDKLKKLLFENEHILKFVSINLSDEDYSSFAMTKEYFLDVFTIRLEINDDIGIVTKGLAKTIENIKEGKDRDVISHSINNGNFLIYTNKDITKILGFIDFS